MKFSLLKNRNYLFYVLGNSTSLFGTVFMNVSLSLYVLQLTGSAGKFASILALGIIPNILFGLLAGALVDRMNRRRLLIWLDLGRGIYLILLFLSTLFHPLSLTMVYVTVVFFSLCEVFFSPAYTTVLPSIVSKQDLVDGHSLRLMITETLRVCAPFVSSWMFTVCGIGTILLVNGISFLISVFTVTCMNYELKHQTGKRVSILRDIADGFQLFRRDPRLTSLVGNGLLTHVFMFSYLEVGIPFIIIKVFGGANTDYGTVQSFATFGSLCSILIIAQVKKKFPVSQAIGVGLVGMVFVVLPMLLLGSGGFVGSLSSHPAMVPVFFSVIHFLLYLFFNTYSVFFATFYQGVVPTDQLGRFISTMQMVYAVGRFAGFQMFGWLFDNFSLVVPVAMFGIGLLLKVLIHVPFLISDKKMGKTAA